MIRILTIAFSLAVLAVSAAPASAGLLSSPLGTTTVHKSGIIMRDGGICDPNRHMGC